MFCVDDNSIEKKEKKGKKRGESIYYVKKWLSEEQRKLDPNR